MRQLQRESGWVLRLHQGYFYAYPYGQINGVTGFGAGMFRALNKQPWLEKFHYWNNVDKDRTPKAEWYRRGDLWEEVLDLPALTLTTFSLWELSGMEVEMIQHHERELKDKGGGRKKQPGTL